MLVAAVLHAASLAVCPSAFQQVGQLSDGGVVCEDLRTLNGSFQILGGASDGLTLRKRVYSQKMTPTWGGLNSTDVFMSKADVLAKQFLASGEPTYEEVLNSIPPIMTGWGSNPGLGYAGQHTFVSSRQADLQAIFDHFGDVGTWPGYPRPPIVIGDEWNPATVDISEGLVGGSLLIVQFTYIVNATVRWEMTVVAVDDTKGNREQPVMFRYARVQNGVLDKQIIYNTYLYNPSLNQPTPTDFYDALVAHHSYWTKTWQAEGSTTIAVPEQVLQDQAVHSLLRDMVTRADMFWPKYGVCGDPGGCAYGDPHNNGFPEIFTSSMMASLEWGLFNYSKGVLNNYLEFYILSGGGINYRGLEMAQSARMLTCIALYYRYTRDATPLATYADKVTGIAQLLLSRVRKARTLPQSDAKYGMPIGNDEADLFREDVGPAAGKTELPFYSIALATIRGFMELGSVLVETGNPTFGNELLSEAAILRQDFTASLGKSRNGTCFPYVAGAGTCAELPASIGISLRDSEPWRTYSEMFYANVLDKSVVEAVYNWNANNEVMMRAGVLSGSGSDCCGTYLMAFTAHGWGYGLLQNDMIPEFVLNFFTSAAHTYTRGTWTAPEETEINGQYAMPYATSSQLTVPLFLKWMVLLDDVDNGVVWYGKGVPRAWYSKVGAYDAVSVTRATSRFGGVPMFKYYVDLTSSVAVFTSTLNSPPKGSYVRFRAPATHTVVNATLNSTALPWNSSQEAVLLPATYNNAYVEIVFSLNPKLPCTGFRC
ncbi:hypothetical protein DIPPA_19917 [Diplonema papillatum]|nr:hypothetical protein DIPPA_19917 [Diplonema papillatum]